MSLEIAAAAKMLGISRPTLYDRIQRYKIETAAVIPVKAGLKTSAGLAIAKCNHTPEIVADLNPSGAECRLDQAVLSRGQVRL